MKIFFKEVNIKDFPNRVELKEICLTELNKINIIFGNNGVGKSTIAEALKSILWYGKTTAKDRGTVYGRAVLDDTEVEFHTQYENPWSYKLDSANETSRSYYNLGLSDFITTKDNSEFINYIKNQTSGGIDLNSIKKQPRGLQKNITQEASFIIEKLEELEENNRKASSVEALLVEQKQNDDKIKENELAIKNIQELKKYAEYIKLENNIKNIEAEITSNYQSNIKLLTQDIRDKYLKFSNKPKELEKEIKVLEALANEEIEINFDDSDHNSVFNNIENKISDFKDTNNLIKQKEDSLSILNKSLIEKEKQLNLSENHNNYLGKLEIDAVKDIIGRKYKNGLIDGLLEDIRSKGNSPLRLIYFIAIFALAGLGFFTNSLFIAGTSIVILIVMLSIERNNHKIDLSNIKAKKENLNDSNNLIERPDQLVWYLDNANRYNQNLEEINVLKQSLEELLEKRNSLENDIKELLGKYKECKNTDFNSELIYIKNKFSDFLRIKEKKEELEKKQKELIEVNSELNNIYNSIGVNSEIEFLDINKDFESYQKISNTLKTKKEELENKDVKKFPLTFEEVEEEISKEDELQKEIGTLKTANGALQTNINNYKGYTNSEINNAIYRKKEEIQDKYNKLISYYVKELTCTEVENRCATFSHDVKSKACELFERFTNNRYTADFSDQMIITSALKNNLKLEELSNGTKCQLLLATRLAFIETQEKDVKYPLFLDECLVGCDDETTKSIIETLEEIASSGRQIFYFSPKRNAPDEWKTVIKDTSIYKEISI